MFSIDRIGLHPATSRTLRFDGAAATVLAGYI